MATILTKKKDTTGAPVAGDLTNSSGGAELAVNTADKRLYTKDSGGNVVEVGTNPGTAVTFTAGTVSAPAITTTGDTNTGVFFPAADTIAFAEGGAEAMRINSDSQVVTTAGTASLPAITTTGDVNTGIFFPAADTIAFAEGGVEAMRINSSGNVGIGTTSPNQLLEIAKEAPVLRITDTDTTATTGQDLGQLQFYTNDADGAHIGASIICYSDDSLGRINGIKFGVSKTNFADATEAMRITSGGNLGIGTTSPSYAFHVQGASKSIYLNDNSSGLNLRLYNGTSSAGISGLTYPNQIISGSANALEIFTSGSSPLVFGTNTTERARITSDGYFLIGTSTTASDARLVVNNPDNVSGDFVFVSLLGSNCNNTSSYHYIASTGGSDKYYIYGNGTTGTPSDIRLKKNVETARNGYLEDLVKLRIVKYNWKTDEENTPKELGVIAQEVEQVFPGIVSTKTDEQTEEETKSVKHSVFVPMLIKAVQELKAITDSQATRIEALEAEVAALKGQ